MKEREPDHHVTIIGAGRPVSGANGFTMAEHLANDRVSAYEGLTMPGLPNYFMSYCAYSGVGGSWHPLVQVSTKHTIRVIEECHRRGATRVEVKPSALERFQTMVDQRMSASIFKHRDCSGARSDYLDQHGDAPALHPTSTRAAVKASRTFPLDDYTYTQPLRSAARTTPVGAVAA